MKHPVRFLRRFLAFLGLAVGCFSCVETYDPALSLTADVLVVDGTLSDLTETQVVKISRSRVYGGRTSSTVPVSGAQVTVTENGTTVLTFREVLPGVYQGPGGFRGQVGSTYQLRFTLSDGQRYESGAERLAAVPKITNLFDQFDAKGIANAEKTQFTPANLLYIDTQDPASERNFYRWTWTLWEQETWCASCQRGKFNLTNPATGDGTCQQDYTLPADNWYDYACLTACWDIFRSYDLNLFSDVYSNGKPITAKLVAKIPYYQAQSALVEIRQYSLSVGAYQYYRLFESQTQSTGGLADTPPAPIVGNIRNVANDKEPVVGYFSASGVSSYKYVLRRQNASGRPIGLLETLLGHSPNPEPSSFGPQGIRPPAARCVPSDTRTPIRPDGWPQ